MTPPRFFRVRGDVQGVMFRQTFIRAAHSRGLEAGATNLPSGEVAFTLIGDVATVDELVSRLTQVRPLNSWGALVAELVEEEAGTPIDQHQVTTANVDRTRWQGGVDMYL